MLSHNININVLVSSSSLPFCYRLELFSKLRSATSATFTAVQLILFRQRSLSQSLSSSSLRATTPAISPHRLHDGLSAEASGSCNGWSGTPSPESGWGREMKQVRCGTTATSLQTDRLADCVRRPSSSIFKSPCQSYQLLDSFNTVSESFI